MSPLPDDDGEELLPETGSAYFVSRRCSCGYVVLVYVTWQGEYHCEKCWKSKLGFEA